MGDDNPEDENQRFNVPRLEILSLRKAIDLTVRESQVTVTVGGSSVENEAELKSKIVKLWFYFTQILEREEEYGTQAIHLIQVLSYLGGFQRIDYGLVDLEYNGSNGYNYRSKKIFNVLELLDTYGLIQVEVIEHPAFRIDKISLPNDLWMSVIREKNGRNQNLEIDLLRTCFNMVEKGNYSALATIVHFNAISPYMLKHGELVKQFKNFFLLLTRYFKEQLQADILKIFDEVFGQFDPETLGLRFRHLKMMLESKDKEAENKSLLTKCKAARVIFDEVRDHNYMKFWSISQLIYDRGSQSQDLKYAEMFYEESLCWYKMIQTHIIYHMGLSRDDVLVLYNLKDCVKTMMKILIGLDRSEDIHDLFCELRRELIKKISENELSDFDHFLSSMIEVILEMQNPTLRKSIFEELSKISESIFKSVLSTQKENIKWMKMKVCTKFPKIVKNLINCLMECGQFDQILNVIQETDLVWQHSVQILLTNKNWKEIPHITSYTDGHLDIHNLIFNIFTKNQDVKDDKNPELKQKLLMESISVIMELCLSASAAPLLNCSLDKFSYMSFVGKCLIELNQMNELINFMNNLEKLSDTPENNTSQICNFFYALKSEGMIDFCAMIMERLAPLNGRVECLPVLEKSLQITKKFLSVGCSSGMRSCFEETALKIITLCESNLEH